MKTKISLVLNLFILLSLSLGGHSVQAGLLQSLDTGDSGGFKPVVGEAVQFDISPTLRSIPPETPERANAGNSHAALTLPKTLKRTSSSAELQNADPVLQDSQGTSAMPEPINSFDGVGNENLVLPPDTEGDIGFDPASGHKYYVQWVNLSFAIWDVTGTPTKIYGPVSGNTLWKGFGGPCETTNHGDPITLYDPLAQRWLMSQFSVNGPFYQCIAISKTGDPTGAWFRYAFLISNTKMNDYPHFGVWPDGYYMTINQFNLDNSWGGTGVVVFNREKMLVGQQAGFQYFDLYSVNSNFGGMLPSDLDGLNPPPPGSPNYFLEVDDSSWIGPQDAIRLWKFHVDWNNPANTTFGTAGQPNTIIPTAAWTPLCEGISACVPQPGTSARLDAIGDRLMYRLAYRNFGDHEALVVNHTVAAGSGQAGIRWYEVRDPGGVPLLYQQGTYAPDSNYRWMGSIAQDRIGDIALGYSVSSSSVYPSVRYSGRLAEDPAGLMTQAEAVLVAGGGSQTHASSRWGDYSTLSVDPVDDCTFWYTQEYYATTSSSAWKTRIGSFRFPGCSDATPGKISGLVSDASSGQPISGATLKASSSNGIVYQTISAGDGKYNLLLAPGMYDLSAAAYGFISQTQLDIQVEAGITTTANFSLNPTEKFVVSGTVRDQLTGWPLYAHISITSDPIDPSPPFNQVWTDPLTGQYSATLAAGSNYQLQVDSFSPGYMPTNFVTGILTGNQSQDFMLAVDQETCSAPGYTRHSDGYGETFDAAETPSGWSIVDNAASGAIWRFDNPKPRPNYSGGSGNFAIIDSDYEGPVDVDSELLIPAFDLTAYPTATLEFKYDFNWYEYGQDEHADVDMSVDGGSHWSNIWQRFGAGDRGPKTARVDISSLAGGKPNVLVRFHYYQANFEWWWQVDDFFIGRQSCDPEPGGLVVGEISDANNSAALPGAMVHSDTASSTTAEATLDPHVPGAFYAMFSPAGSHVFTATAGTQYGTLAKSTDVALGTVSGLDFSLPAGWIGAEPGSLDITLKAGLTATRVITLSNSGGLTANFQISEVEAPVFRPGTVGPFAPAERRVSPAHLYDADAHSVRIYDPPEVPALAAGDLVRAWDSGLQGAWGIAYDTSPGDLWLSDIGLLKGDDWDHRFQSDGTATGDRIDTTAWGSVFAADMAYDPLSDRLWQAAVGADNCIYELDPVNLTSTGHKLCPGFGVSMRGLAYDPVSDTFYSGSWNDQILYHFDSSGRLIDSKDIRLNISGLAFNPLDGHLFVLSNAGVGYDVYLLDVTNGYSPVGGFDIPGLGAFEQAGLTLDCSGNLWAVNQSTGQVIEARSGETTVCAWSEIPWLSASPLTGSLAPSDQQPISLNFDAQTISPGVYPAFLRVSSDTPYAALDLPVTMTVRLDYDFVIIPEASEKIGAPGEQITFQLQIENTGLQSDEYKVELQDNQWTAQVANTIGPLNPGEVVTLPVTVTVPLDATCNALDDFAVVLTSRNEPARTAAAALRASASLICGVDLQPADSTLFGAAGKEIIHALHLTNTGNITDRFNLTITNNSAGWKVYILPNTPAELTLAPFASVDLSVHIVIPPDALAGQVQHVTIQANSVGDDSQIASSELTTEVKVYNFYLLFIPR